MHSIAYLTLDKDVQQSRQSDFDAFAAQIQGGALSRAADTYDKARKVWNATVDRHPALIARCLTEDRAERVSASCGANDPRLRALKQRFDTDNLLRINPNIAAASKPRLQASRWEPPFHLQGLCCATGESAGGSSK